jgi:hypothetical protein
MGLPGFASHDSYRIIQDNVGLERDLSVIVRLTVSLLGIQ